MKLSTVTGVCLAHGTAHSSDTVERFVSDCPNMLQSALSVLGTRATTVVRMMATDCLKDCAENVIVGFADGDLEGTFMVPVQPGTADLSDAGVTADAQPDGVALMSTDWRWAAYPLHQLPASAWPWKDAAPFDSPKVKRTDLRLAPATLRDRTPLPFCGLMWEGPGPEQNPEARACFERAVRTGHPAEYITHASGTEGQDLWGLYRFTGTASVEEWNVAIGQYEDGKWRMGRISLPVYEN